MKPNPVFKNGENSKNEPISSDLKKQVPPEHHHPHPAPWPSEEFTTLDLDHPPTCLNLLNALVVPRPIAFITSQDQEKVLNAAPFSYFNVVCTNPAVISVAIERRKGKRKDTARNILSAREFVVNICSQALAKIISVASGDFPPHVSEVELNQLTLIPSDLVTVPRIANTPAQLECALLQHIEVGENQCDLFLARVVKLHVQKNLFHEGYIDIEGLNPLARAGSVYGKVHEYFFIPRGI